MIVTDVNGRPGGVLVDAAGRFTRWTCLARRGMLHAECEAIDFFALDPQARLAKRGGPDVAEIWFVVSGSAVTADGHRAGPGSLVVLGPGASGELTASTELTVITVSVLPDRLARRLPPRSPDMTTAGQTAGRD